MWCLGCALLLVAVAESVEAQERQPIERLEGVVVSKTDGQPIAGAKVAMAHVESGSLYIGSKGHLTGFGPQETVLLFFPKRNSKSFCEAKTDAQGRFKLESFRDPATGYVIAAAHAEKGVVVMPVVPGEHAEKPLRIEVEPPAFIEVDQGLSDPPFGLSAYWNVELVAPLDRHVTSRWKRVGEDAQRRVSMQVWSFFDERSDAEDAPRFGPLPPGWRYRLTLSAWAKNLAYNPTLLEREVALEPGAVVKIEEQRGGAMLQGQVRGTDGAPLKGVNVILRSKRTPGLALGAITDSEGRYRISSVPAGAHEVELLRHAVRTGPG